MMPTPRRRPRHALIALIALVLTLVATSCTTSNQGSATATSGSDSTTAPSALGSSTTTSAPSRARFAATSCQTLLHLDAAAPESVMTCGYLSVPEDRSRPQGRTVRLAVVRLRSHAATPKPDPVVYLHGGPGIATLPEGLGSRLSSPVLDERDLIVFDQRGSGLSEPDLQCPERERAFLDALGSPRGFAAELASFETATKGCYERLRSSGIDLDQYDTVQNAADLADLRVALGIREWNLWGVSYGTRLALETMRSHPHGIRSAVLDSVYAPSVGRVDDVVTSSQQALAALDRGCAADAACHAAYPDVARDVRTLIAALDRRPSTFTYDPPDGASRRLRITGQDAAAGLFNAMYSTEVIAQLPALLHELASGDTSLVPAMAQTVIPFVNQASEGAGLSFECADNGAKIDPARVAELRARPGDASMGLLTGWNLVCADWPVAALPGSFGDVVRSDVPTLVLAGEYDPTTPASGSRAAADALAHSVFVEVPRGGHAPTSPCSAQIFRAFFDDLTKVDTSCVASQRPEPFAIR